jgi:ribonuclease HII
MITPNYKLESEKLKQGYNYVIGIDEAGRGCLAGPVVAAAVLLDPVSVKNKANAWYKDIRDSKLLSAEKRFILEQLIKDNSITWGVGEVPHNIVDNINIHNATLLAMTKAVNSFKKTLERFDAHGTESKSHLLIDGKFILQGLEEAQYLTQEAIVGGDAKVLSISAASILAKTHRDRLMVKLHQKFPEYNFAKHKGYATLEHRIAVKTYGLSSVHRLSFCSNIV